MHKDIAFVLLIIASGVLLGNSFANGSFLSAFTWPPTGGTYFTLGGIFILAIAFIVYAFGGKAEGEKS